MDIDELSNLIEQSEGKEKVSKEHSKGHFLRKRDLRLFAESLSRLLTGGIPILKALEAIKKSVGIRNEKFVKFVQKVNESIRQGASLKESFEDTKSVPPFFSQIVYAGEISGSTPLVLDELAAYMRKQEALRRKILEAFTYPLFLLAMGVMTLGVLLRVVIPKLALVYKDFDAELPWITKTILSLSDLFFPFCLLTIVIFSIFAFLLIRKKEILLIWAYKAPYFGKLLQMCVLIQFSRLFRLLLESGIVILEALEITGRTFSNFLENDISSIREKIMEGKSFSNALESIDWMDDLSKMLVTSGEETGKIPESFAQIAQDTENILDAQIQFLMKLLEPTLILGIGMVVGFIVIGTVLPIFDISGLMK